MVLNIRELKAWHGDVQALFGINLKVDKSELVVLLGNKGAGKTTILKAIFNEVDRKEGKILYWDEDITKTPPGELIKRGLSYVPTKCVFQSLNVRDNLLLGAYASKEGIKEPLAMVFEIFPELKAKRKKKASALNPKESAMLAIARALMIKPKLVLIDEPSAGLLPKDQRDIFMRIKNINKKGVAILLAEQNAHSGLAIAENAYVIENGRNLTAGKPEEILRRYSKLV